MTCRRQALRLSRYFLRGSITMRPPKIPRRKRNRMFGTGPDVATSIFESEGAIDVPPLQGLGDFRAWSPGPALALLAPAQAVIGRAFSPLQSAPSAGGTESQARAGTASLLRPFSGFAQSQGPGGLPFRRLGHTHGRPGRKRIRGIENDPVRNLHTVEDLDRL